MPKRLNLTGNKFGKLTVIGPEFTYSYTGKWRVRCDCGNERVVFGTSLTSGNTKSCGCLRYQNTGRPAFKMKERRFVPYDTFHDAFTITPDNLAEFKQQLAATPNLLELVIQRMHAVFGIRVESTGFEEHGKVHRLDRGKAHAMATAILYCVDSYKIVKPRKQKPAPSKTYRPTVDTTEIPLPEELITNPTDPTDPLNLNDELLGE